MMIKVVLFLVFIAVAALVGVFFFVVMENPTKVVHKPDPDRTPPPHWQDAELERPDGIISSEK